MMNQDLRPTNEYNAVSRLIVKIGATHVYKGRDLSSAEEFLGILQNEFDHEPRYILENGPTDDSPGVYRLEEDGEINPRPVYTLAELSRWYRRIKGKFNFDEP